VRPYPRAPQAFQPQVTQGAGPVFLQPAWTRPLAPQVALCSLFISAHDRPELKRCVQDLLKHPSTQTNHESVILVVGNDASDKQIAPAFKVVGLVGV